MTYKEVFVLGDATLFSSVETAQKQLAGAKRNKPGKFEAFQVFKIDDAELKRMIERGE